ncbi:unnamed protein product [Cuscuta campestris]|uniref:Uncharacterized protein n=2 Tax=Cuscuta campestris TaxID=132261 RepID=A0A484MH51_9ASTE|nr:unnamed protein product [Cuscuta campestris]
MEKVKRQGAGETGANAADSFKRRKMSAISDGAAQAEGGGDTMAWLIIDDEAMTELSELLDTAEVPPHDEGFRVRFIDDPYSPPVLFRSTAYVTIDVNEESCGSSFSDLESSVMASIDTGGGAGGWLRRENRCAWGSDARAARGWVVETDFPETETPTVKDMDERDGSCIWVNGAGDDDSIWENFLGEI